MVICVSGGSLSFKSCRSDRGGNKCSLYQVQIVSLTVFRRQLMVEKEEEEEEEEVESSLLEDMV